MDWISAIVGGVAGIAALPSELEAINQQNKATIEGYNATNDALSFTQTINENNARQAAEAIANEMGEVSRDQKLQQAQTTSSEVSRRGQGVTAGYSAGRTVQTIQVAQQKDLTKTEQKGVSSISLMYEQMENDNNQLQQQKRSAWNQANGQIITKEEASNKLMQSVTQGLGG